MQRHPFRLAIVMIGVLVVSGALLQSESVSADPNNKCCPPDGADTEACDGCRFWQTLPVIGDAYVKCGDNLVQTCVSAEGSPGLNCVNHQFTCVTLNGTVTLYNQGCVDEIGSNTGAINIQATGCNDGTQDSCD